VLDDAADVVQGGLGQAGVAVAGKDVFAALADRLVHVHAGAVVADQGLGHEGRRLAVGVGHVVDAVLEDLHFVGLALSVLNLTPISHWPAVPTSW
jgi:hypothetical protein